MKFPTPLRLGAVLVLAASLALSACGDDKTTDASDGSKVSGKVAVTGSSTVEPISAGVGEAFRTANPDVDISVEGPGTGDGFKKFCAGEFDVADASRKIKDEEKAACAAKGVEYVELEIGLDALTVMTDDKNEAVGCLTFADIYGLVGPESDDVATWSDAKKHGATSDLPDADLKIFAPGQESGTYDSMYDLALKSTAEKNLGKDNKKKTRSYDGLADDNQIVEGITGFATSFGWVGFAYADQTEGVKKLPVDGGKGCVEPSRATVEDNTYPLSRGLYIYVNKKRAADNKAVAAFVDYYLSTDGIKTVVDKDYVAMPADKLEASRAAWKARA